MYQSKEIAEFCSSKYGVTFDMFEKVDVNGDDACDNDNGNKSTENNNGSNHYSSNVSKNRAEKLVKSSES